MRGILKRSIRPYVLLFRRCASAPRKGVYSSHRARRSTPNAGSVQAPRLAVYKRCRAAQRYTTVTSELVEGRILFNICDSIMPTVEVIDPPTLGKPNPLYGNITAAKLSPTTTLYTIAGQVAQDPATGEVPAGLAAQLPVCLKRIGLCLEHIGAKKTDIIRLMYYIRQGALDDHEAAEGQGSGLRLIGGVAGKWLEGHRPASCYNRSFGMSDDRYACEFEAMVVLSQE